jgi:VIT1/CCC1 family predicted Fe2+/Mn2+ transporter
MKSILVCLAIALMGLALGVTNALVGVSFDANGIMRAVTALAPLGYVMMITGITGTVFLSMRAVVHKA